MKENTNWAIITITKNGTALAARCKTHFPTLEIIAKYPEEHKNITPLAGKLAEHIPTWFAQYDALIFVMATGIVVRSIAPYLQHKSTDPAILVMDEAGQFVISLLSGHLGGANKITQQLAEKLSAQAVITTATDTQGKQGLDLFAQEQGLQIVDWKALVRITAQLVNHQKLAFINKTTRAIQLPDYAVSPQEADGLVYISHRIEQNNEKDSVTFIAPQYMLGIGCRRGKTAQELIDFTTEELKKINIAKEWITRVVSIEFKSDEQGIHDLAKHLDVRTHFYDTAEIATVEDQFEGSDFVLQTLGVRAVSEPAAYLAGRGKGKFLVQKAKKDGMTLSVFETKHPLAKP